MYPRLRVALPALRWQAALTQAQLAARAGIHPSTLNRLEWQKGTPSARTIRRIADALGINPTELVIVEDTPRHESADMTALLDTIQANLGKLSQRMPPV